MRERVAGQAADMSRNPSSSRVRLGLAVGGLGIVRALALSFLGLNASLSLGYLHDPVIAGMSIALAVVTLAVLLSGGLRVTMRRRVVATCVPVAGILAMSAYAHLT